MQNEKLGRGRSTYFATSVGPIVSLAKDEGNNGPPVPCSCCVDLLTRPGPRGADPISATTDIDPCLATLPTETTGELERDLEDPPESPGLVISTRLVEIRSP